MKLSVIGGAVIAGSIALGILAIASGGYRMPNARALELTIRQQAMIVYALEGYADGEKVSLYECGEVIDLIRLIQSADALLATYRKPA